MQSSSTNRRIDSSPEFLNELSGRLSARWRFIFVVCLKKVFPNRKLYECMPLANDFSFFASLLVFGISMINLGISVFNLNWFVSLPLAAGFLWARKCGKISGTGIFLFWGFCAATVNSNGSLTFRALLLILTCAIVVIGLRQRRMIKEKFASKPFRLDNINTGSARILSGNIMVLNLFVAAPDSKRRWTPRSRKQSLREIRHAFKWLILQAEKYNTELKFNSQTLFPQQRFSVISHPPYSQVIAHEILHLFGADDFYMEAYGLEEDNQRSESLRGNIMFETTPLLSDLEIDYQTAEKIGWR